MFAYHLPEATLSNLIVSTSLDPYRSTLVHSGVRFRRLSAFKPGIVVESLRIRGGKPGPHRVFNPDMTEVKTVKPERQ